MDNYEALKNDIEKNINEMVNDLNLNVDSNNQMKNRFVEWMLKNQFEQKTVNNYTNAISVVSREAINENLINKPIYDIDNVKELDELLEKLNQNQTYIERRLASHNTNSAAMNQYRKFLEDINMTTIEEDNINIIEKFKKYYFDNIEEYKLNEEAINGIKLREKFNVEYPITKLKNMSLEEYALGTDNFVNSLSYKLEFGEYKHAGMGCGGGSSAKHGIYFSKDNVYRGYKNPNLPTTEFGWEIDPMGFRATIREMYSRYRLPMIVTENGLGAYDKLTEDGKVHDQYRIEYLRKHIEQIQLAITDGAEMMGYCPWSAIDLISTHEGMVKRYGFIYVDRDEFDLKTLDRYRKDSFYWYKKVISSNGEDLTD